MRGLFISGTDTGVGKTFVTALLARSLRRRGLAVAVCKPVATGAAPGQPADDTRLLHAAIDGTQELASITPWTFAEPAAPPVAARAAGATLYLADLVAAVRRLVAAHRRLLVEGVGGLLCPLTDRETVADLAAQLDLPLLIVARRSLGTLNHTLLTVEAARHRGLAVAGVVVNETTPPASLAEQTNVEELIRRLPVPVLGVVPFGATAESLDPSIWKIVD